MKLTKEQVEERINRYRMLSDDKSHTIGLLGGTALTLYAELEKAEAECKKLTKGIITTYERLGYDLEDGSYTSDDALEMVNEMAGHGEDYKRMAIKAEAENKNLKELYLDKDAWETVLKNSVAAQRRYEKAEAELARRKTIEETSLEV